MIKWIPFDNTLHIDIEKARFFEPLFSLDGDYLVKYKYNNEYKIGVARLIYRNVFNVTNLLYEEEHSKKYKLSDFKNKKLISFKDIQEKSNIINEEKKAEIEKEAFLSQLEDIIFDAIEYTIGEDDNEEKELKKEKIINIEDIKEHKKNKDLFEISMRNDVITEQEYEELLSGPDYMYYLDFQQMEEDKKFEIIEKIDDEEKYKFLLYFYKEIYTNDQFKIQDIEALYELDDYMNGGPYGNTPDESGDYIVEINYYYKGDIRYEYRVGKYLKKYDKWVFNVEFSNIEKEDIVAYKKLPVLNNNDQK